VPLHLLPPIGAIWGAMACRDGAIVKGYGAYNWRETPISYMGYLGALDRHRICLIGREDYALDSLVHHLGHINATSSILLDAEAHGTLIDDRPSFGKSPGYREAELLAELRKKMEAGEI